MKIKYWITTGVVYVALVIVGYSLITGENPLASGGMDHNEHKEENHEEAVQTEEDETMEDHQGHSETATSEIETNVSYKNKQIQIELADEAGEAPSLLENHEKEMHLIVVSEDLEDFIHLHPEQEEAGRYLAETVLNEGRYKAFVDIKPKEKAYTVGANVLEVGDLSSSQDKAELIAEESLTKERVGKTVTLNPSNLNTSETANFSFDLHGEVPQPYLGALGHVVILDEAGETFLHVHPASAEETVFETHFEQPGRYKVWAEFKFTDSGVLTFPFVIEVS